MGYMSLRVEAVYENGVLRPLQPLELSEHEHVIVNVLKSQAETSQLDVEYIESVREECRRSGPAPALEEVRARLAKIPGSMAADIIADRGEV
jgi:predicted DNA-binding antitoxin AbrB/MazE fold protein